MTLNMLDFANDFDGKFRKSFGLGLLWLPAAVMG